MTRPENGPTLSRGPALWRWVMIALLLGVFFLYVHFLDRQSLWFDEGLSVAFASRPLGELMRTLVGQDLHPPLYYLILHFWIALAGSSEMAVRLPSMLAVCLMLPLAFAVVREIEGKVASSPDSPWLAGLAGAAVAGTSPFIAYYAQETRMYALAALLCLAATWAYLVALRGQESRGRWIGFSVLLAASLYTQYFTAMIIPAFLVYGLLLEQPQLKRTLTYLLVTALLYVPWIGSAYQQLARLLVSPDYWVSTHIDLRTFLRALLHTLFPGVSAAVLRSKGAFGALAALALILVVLGLARNPSIRARLRPGRSLPGTVRRWLLVLLTFLSPVALTYVVVSLAPKFATRYTITAVAPLYISGAVAANHLLGRKGRRAGALYAASVLAVVVLSLHPTIAITEGKRDARDDARGLANYLTANVRSDDAILLMENAPYALLYYYRGTAPWYGLHVGTGFQGGADVLNTMLQTRPARVWLVLWHQEFADPSDMVVTELLRIGIERELPAEFLGYDLRAFDIERPHVPVQAIPTPSQPVDALVPGGVQLIGFDRLEPSNGRLSYVLYWQADQTPDSNLSCTLSLESQDGAEYLRLDQALSTPYFLPPAWPLKVPIRGRVDVPLRSDLPVQRYRVLLRVFDPRSNGNLNWTDSLGRPVGEALLLEELDLAKSQLTGAAENPPVLLDLPVTPVLQLRGTDLKPVKIRAGGTIHFGLWWQASRLADTDVTVRFCLRDGHGAEMWCHEQPVAPNYPLPGWSAGETNRILYSLVAPATLETGQYELVISAGSETARLVVIDAEAMEHVYVIPPMQNSVEAEFEQGISLLGFDLASRVVRPGASLTVTIYWQADRRVPASYKVSLQLLAPGLRLLAQNDSVPVGWTYPTTVWIPGEIIRDEHSLAISTEASGDCTLIVALYDERTGRRLRPEGGSGDFWVLANITVAP